jgi:hypothetical protein
MTTALINRYMSARKRGIMAARDAHSKWNGMTVSYVDHTGMVLKQNVTVTKGKYEGSERKNNNVVAAPAPTYDRLHRHQFSINNIYHTTAFHFYSAILDFSYQLGRQLGL